MPGFIIEPLSDLCVSNGESFGGVIDLDVSCDDYGVPVIRGKSLKGCLRETAEELMDCGIVTSQFIDDVFGVKGAAKSGKLFVFDAHPVGYFDYLKEIKECNLSRSQVMEYFTSTRTQTSIDDETGTAKRNSLRTIRVINRNIAFQCEYILDICDSEKQGDYAENFKKCIALLRHIGVNRTRGLGEVKCTPNDVPTNSKFEKVAVSENQRLKYEITTLSHLIPTKENPSIDYIPGSTIMGLCFEHIGKEKMIEYLDKGLSFTNALPSDGRSRFPASPAFFAKQKEAQSDKGLPVYIFDTDRCKNADPPAMALKGMAMAINGDFDSFSSISVKREVNYHHKQSDDNPGIIDGVNFYQLSSLCAGQRFSGYIDGSKEILQSICDALSAENTVSLGYYKTGGYGRCRLSLCVESVSSDESAVETAAICLNSPVIMYNNEGMPCAAPDVFKKYIEYAIPNCSVEILQKYLRYTQLGGYNVTWGMRKQGVQAYDAGTCFVVKLSNNVPLSQLNQLRIGERTAEGFGEIAVFDYEKILKAADKEIIVCKADAPVCEETGTARTKHISAYLADKRLKESIRKKAYENAEKVSVNPSQIGRLALMCDETTGGYDKFIKTVSDIKDEKRRAAALSFVDMTHTGIDTRYYKEYLNALLTHAKYILRKKEG